MVAQYDKRELVVLDEPGTVYITSHSRGYDPQLMKMPEQKSTGGWFGGGQRIRGSSTADVFKEDLHIQTQITDKLRLEVVQNAELEPAYKSLYVGARNPWTLRIKHGSGEFAVTPNNTSVARVEHRGREVTILPHSEGVLGIEVRDVLLPDSVAVSAEILISDVAKLHLET